MTQNKKQPTTINRVFLILIGIVIFLGFILFTAFGFLPFISHLMSGLIIKGMTTFANYLNLFAKNSPLNTLSPLFTAFKFIIDTFSVFIGTSIMAALSMIILFYAKSNDYCDAFQKSVFCGITISMIFCFFYILFSIPTYILNFLKVDQSPNVFVKTTAKLIRKLKMLLIPLVYFLIPPLATTYTSFLNGISIFTQKTEVVKEIINKYLNDFNSILELIKVDPYKTYVDKLDLKPIINIVSYSYKNPKEQQKIREQLNKDPKLKKLSNMIIKTSYLSKWTLSNFLGLILIFIETLSLVCDPNASLIKGQKVQNKNTETLKNLNPAATDFLKQFKSYNINNTNLLCIVDYFEAGILSSGITLIMYIIIFFVYLFRPPMREQSQSQIMAQRKDMAQRKAQKSTYIRTKSKY